MCHVNMTSFRKIYVIRTYLLELTFAVGTTAIFLKLYKLILMYLFHYFTNKRAPDELIT